MTPSQFLEVLVSLSLQVAVVVGTTYWVGRRVNEKWHCRLWTNCYVLLLLLAGMALVLPHPRFFHPWKSVPLTQQANALAIESHAGQWFLYL
jgi:bla regulator protein blaR1